MPNLPDASLPILASPFSPATTAKVILCGMISLPLIGTSLYYASPARLTLVLSDAMSNLEKVYADMVCSRILRLLPCNEVEHLGSSLRILQLKVDKLQTETLLHSLSWRTTICEFLKGRSLTLFGCINEVRDLETRIRILERERM